MAPTVSFVHDAAVNTTISREWKTELCEIPCASRSASSGCAWQLPAERPWHYLCTRSRSRLMLSVGSSPQM